MELLVDHDWPGNIRELENVIQGAVIRADGDSISRADLPEHLQPAGEPDKVVDSFEPDGFEQLLRSIKSGWPTKRLSIATETNRSPHGNSMYPGHTCTG